MINEPPKPYLSPAELAEVLGLSVSTLKRWTDKGLLRVERTAGGHRRIATHEALRFVRESGLKPVLPQRLGLRLSGLASAEDGASPEAVASADAHLGQLLLSGSSDEARRCLVAAFVGGVPAAVLGDAWVRPGLERVGELCMHGPDGIAIEHQASDAIMRALAEMRALVEPAASAPIAIGCSPAGDPYVIPSALADLVLAVSGFRSTSLGADLPRPALLAAVARMQPRLVWLSVSVDEAEGCGRAALERLAATLGERGAALVIGGRAAPEHVTGATMLRDLGALQAFSRGLLS